MLVWPPKIFPIHFLWWVILVLTNYAQLLLYISYKANLHKLLNMKESENCRGKVSPPNMRGPTPSGFAYEIYKSHNFKIDL